MISVGGVARLLGIGGLVASLLPASARSETIVRITQMTYDSMERLQCQAIRMKPTASLPKSACTVVANPGPDGPDRITKNTYNEAGQLIRVQRAYDTPLVQSYAKYTYNADGKRTTVIDANGNKASMTYDTFGRLSAWNFPSKVSPGAVSSTDYEEYGYDNNNNRTRLRKRDGRELSFQYDALNRTTSKVVPDGCAPAPLQIGPCPAADTTRDVFFGYDLLGAQTSARFDSQTGEGVSFSYDALGRTKANASTMGGLTRQLSYEYDELGRRTKVIHQDGIWFRYVYSALDLLDVYDSSGVRLQRMTYDDQGRLAARFGGSEIFDYDDIGRLSVHTLAFNKPYDNATGFTYNAADQVKTASRTNTIYSFTGFVSADRNYSVNGLNQYTIAGPASFTYDSNGNLIGDGMTTWTYDAENRLVASSAGVVARYDPMGRIAHIVKGTSAARRFLYDGDRLVEDYDNTGALQEHYVHENDEDQPFAWYEGGSIATSARRTLIADYQGSIIAIRDGTGTQLSINSYDDYGITKNSGSVAVGSYGAFGYTGQVWLPELGLYYYKARFYSPTLGRFLQVDPVGYDDQINLYAYVANDPVNKVDHAGERISVVIHEVVSGSGQYHTKIVIVPDDQKTFRNDDRFQSDAIGVRFTTIGGGPDTRLNIFGPLVGDINRPKDVSKTLSGESLEVARIAPGKGDNENNLINRIVGVAQSYKDDKPYSLFPSAKGNDYNYNSFAYGVLGAVGVKNVPIPQGYPVPGADKPLPAVNFCKPAAAGCAK